MKRRRGGFVPCKGQVDIWYLLAEVARYKRESVPTEKVVQLLGFLHARYGSWPKVAEVTGINARRLKGWHDGHVQAIDRDHALRIVDVVLAHRKPKEPWASDGDVVRRLPTTDEAEAAHREEQRAWRAYYRARKRGENVQPPGEKDTSRTRAGRNTGGG